MTPEFLYTYSITYYSIRDEQYQSLTVLADSIEDALAKAESYLECVDQNANTAAGYEITYIGRGSLVLYGFSSPEDQEEEEVLEGILSGGFKGIDAVKEEGICS